MPPRARARARAGGGRLAREISPETASPSRARAPCASPPSPRCPISPRSSPYIIPGEGARRQVLPPSFPSATLEIYYADSGGAAGRGEEAAEEDEGQGPLAPTGCRGLRKFKTLFTLRARLSRTTFRFSFLVPTLLAAPVAPFRSSPRRSSAGCMHRSALVTWRLFIYSRG